MKMGREVPLRHSEKRRVRKEKGKIGEKRKLLRLKLE